jgi:hypothetical protein
MPLSKEHIEIILMDGSGSCCKVAMNFNRKHGKHITHNTAAKLTEKFKKTKVLQTNQEVVIHVNQLMKVQSPSCWVHLQGVPKKHVKADSRKLCQHLSEDTPE